MNRDGNRSTAAARAWRATNWQMATFVLLALLLVSNAAWWSAKGIDRIDTVPLSAAGVTPTPHRVIYEYRDPVQAASTATPVAYSSTPLAVGERCAGGQIIRRLPNGWEGTARVCNP